MGTGRLIMSYFGRLIVRGITSRAPVWVRRHLEYLATCRYLAITTGMVKPTTPCLGRATARGITSTEAAPFLSRLDCREIFLPLATITATGRLTSESFAQATAPGTTT